MRKNTHKKQVVSDGRLVTDVAKKNIDLSALKINII